MSITDAQSDSFAATTGLLAEHRYTVATMPGLLRFDERGHRDKSYGACGVARIGSAFSLAAQGRSRVLALTQANAPQNSLHAQTSLVAVRAHGASNPHTRPVFGRYDPYVGDASGIDNSSLRSVARRRPIVVHAETPQRGSLTVMLVTKTKIPGLPRLLARAGAQTKPCHGVKVTLKADRRVRRVIGSLRRKLNRAPNNPGSVDFRIRIVLHNGAGTRRFVIDESLSSFP